MRIEYIELNKALYIIQFSHLNDQPNVMPVKIDTNKIKL